MKTRHSFVYQSAEDLAFLENDSVDLIVTSPPYPMIEMWDEDFAKQSPSVLSNIENGLGEKAFELMHLQLDRVWRECFRVVRDGGFVCINVGDATRKVGNNFRLYTNHSRITKSLESLGFQSLPTVIWRKQTNGPNKFMGSGMLPAGAYVTLEHEYILILRKGDKRSFSPDEREPRRRSAFFWEERNLWFSDLWDFKGTRQTISTSESRTRSAAFPFELAFRLINMYSLQDEVVLDPFAGTGTTMLASMASGRNSINIDIDPSLSHVIDTAVSTAACHINARQIQRYREHLAFVSRYEKEKSRSLAHANTPHGFRVMTKQETSLTLHVVKSIEKHTQNSYLAIHDVLSFDSPEQAHLRGFESVAPSEEQLSLAL